MVSSLVSGVWSLNKGQTGWSGLYASCVNTIISGGVPVPPSKGAMAEAEKVDGRCLPYLAGHPEGGDWALSYSRRVNTMIKTMTETTSLPQPRASSGVSASIHTREFSAKTPQKPCELLLEAIHGMGIRCVRVTRCETHLDFHQDSGHLPSTDAILHFKYDP